ncbi:hypothetical protein [Rheinheimera tilapiae]
MHRTVTKGNGGSVAADVVDESNERKNHKPNSESGAINAAVAAMLPEH